MRGIRYLCHSCLIATLAACSTPAPVGSRTIPIDDSYTISSRFLSNRTARPEIALPVLTMADGQRILFDRLYAAVGERELHLDVFLPPRPQAGGQASGQAVVLVHGGAWRSGNKSNFYAIASLLAQRGYAVFIPEFRLAPEAGYPAGLQDINSALAWVAVNAGSFGIDPARIAIGGESSGGQMAALVAYTGGSSRFTASGQPSVRVNALIDIDGVLDLTSPLALRYENAAGDQSAMARWLGGSWERLPQAWSDASAATYAGPDSPPTLVLAGEDPRFTAGWDQIASTLESNGIAHRKVDFPGLPHTFWLFDPYAAQVVEAIDDFLKDSGTAP